MPNIKKPFALANVKCYKCGKDIPQGSMDWSYNTQKRGLFAHSTCGTSFAPSKTPNSLQNPPANTPEPPKTPVSSQKPTLICPLCNNILDRNTEIYRYDVELSKYVHESCFKNKKPTIKTHSNFVNENEVFFVSPGSRNITLKELRASKPKATKKHPPDITDLITFTLGETHELINDIKIVLRRRRYPFLYGSPGAGKTYLCQQIAKMMNLKFVLVSCAEDLFRSEIIGSRSPLSGAYFSTAAREVWENGGFILFDECGNSSGSFLNTLNAALEQKIIKFADEKTIPMHPNCFIAFADNSALYGTDPLFPERKDAGGAFRDRLTYLETTYDLILELAILTKIFDSDRPRAATWHNAVRSIRVEIAKLNIPIFPSPRFAYKAAEYFYDGVSYDKIMSWELFRGQSIDNIALARAVTDKFKKAY